MFEDYDELNQKIVSGEVQINTHAVGIIFGVVLKIAAQLILDLEKLIRKYSENTMRSFMVSTGRLDLAEIIFYSAIVADPNDIFYQEENSEDWRMLREVMEEHPLRNFKQYKKDITLIVEGMYFGGAIVSKAAEQENPISRFFTTMGKAAKYAVAKKNRKTQYEYFINNPDHNTIQELYGQEDKAMVKAVFSLLIPNINVNEEIYLPFTHEGCSKNYEKFDIKKPQETWWA